MIPVYDNNILLINLDVESLTETDEKYRKLLKKQIYWLNRNCEKVYGRAEKLYNNYISEKLPINIRNRCCDFKLLESVCEEYNKKCQK